MTSTSVPLPTRLARFVLEDYHRYRLLEGLYRTVSRGPVPGAYPTDLNVELTSACNAKCDFCTHDRLVSQRIRPSKHMDLSFAESVLAKLRVLVDGLGIPEDGIRFGPVGLGEPLLYPNLAGVIGTARRLFPNAFMHANTNALLLAGEKAEQLIDCGLDQLIISVCFADESLYRKHIGIDAYGRVMDNIRRFLALKGNRAPRTVIHIFDLPENERNFTQFMRRLAPSLNANDFAGLYKYLPLTEASPADEDISPCSQLWSVLMVDVDGFVFPCCIGVWTRKDEDLCLGHISEPAASLLGKAEAARARHRAGDYRGCSSCAFLRSPDNRAAYARIRGKRPESAASL